MALPPGQSLGTTQARGKGEPHMTKRKESPAKPGRPSKYRQEFDEQARKLCLLGATNKDLAKFFEVTDSTLSLWMVQHESFSEALKAGRQLADAKVGERLYQRAIGYSHPDVHVSNYQGMVTLTPITKHYPPDPVSMIFWLKNRRPDLWRAQPDEGSADAPTPVKVVIEVKDASIPEPT